MVIPFAQLSPDVLTRLIAAFVNRDGTDYGEKEASEADKIQAVRRQLERGEALIVFDAESESCNVVTKAQLPPDHL